MPWPGCAPPALPYGRTGQARPAALAHLATLIAGAGQSVEGVVAGLIGGKAS